MVKAKNWAIVVGINAYKHLLPLRYANRDAAALRDFFQEAKFDRVFCFVDGLQLSPELDRKSTQPRYSDLLSFLHNRFTTQMPPLSAGDNCWFFFAGHGKRMQDCDYLLPQDYDPRLPDPTQLAIPVNFVREALLKSGADNVILLLDACRTEGDRADGLGIGDEQPGAITIFSCQRNQKAYEIERLQHGAFTAALLEGLRMPKASDNCATVQRLDHYLQRRVPELCRLHPERPVQVPVTSVDPGQKWYLLLLPGVATEPDIAMLKIQAYRTDTLDKNLALAKQLWIRIIAATNGQDQEAIDVYAEIRNREKRRPPEPPRPEPPPASLLPDSRSLLDPPHYWREYVPVLLNDPLDDPYLVSQPAQSINSSQPPQETISCTSLALIGFLYALYGWLLTAASAPFWAVALAGTGAGVGFLTWAGAMAWAMAAAWAWAVAEAGAMAWAVAGFLVAVVVGTVAAAVVGAWAVVVAGEVWRSQNINGISKFLILTATSWFGLGLGWLGHWAFKAVSGH